LGDKYKYYKISSILRVSLGNKFTTYILQIGLKINLRQSQKPVEGLYTLKEKNSFKFLLGRSF
jgi:hypothetical protein